MQEYSIGINIYFSKEKIKYTFTIFKVIFEEKENSIMVNCLYDLIQNENNIDKKRKLIEDNKKILNKVLKNKNYPYNDIRLEYEIEEDKK